MDELRSFYEEVNELIPSREKALFHLKSVRNFIYNINEIKNENEKLNISTQIKTYLSIVKNYDIINKDESIDLFYSYILPIGKIYQNIAKFRGYLSFSTIVIWFLFLNFVVYIITQFNYIEIYIILNSLLLVFVTRSLVYTYRKKVFSINY